MTIYIQKYILKQVPNGFQHAIENIWMEIGFEKDMGDLVAGVIGKAKDALSNTLGGNFVQFRKRRDDRFLKDKTLHLTCNVMRMPAARELPTLLLKLRKIFKVAMMKDSTPVVEVTEAGASFVFHVSYPPSMTISFDLTANPGDLLWPRDDPIKFTCEGLKSLACLKDVWTRNPDLANNIPVEMLKAMVDEFDVGGQTKGIIIFHLMRQLSTIVLEPGIRFEAVAQVTRVVIANRARAFLENPRLMCID